MNRRAFTLVELLVVIGIISLLTSILLPAIARSRASAEQVHCLATLRSIGQAARLHANDHHNHLPPAGWHFRLNGQPLSPDSLDDPARAQAIYYRDNAIDRPLPITAALGHYLMPSASVSSRADLETLFKRPDFIRLFHCQSQLESLSGLSQKCDTTGWTSPPEPSSYVFNESILGRRNADPDRLPSPMGNLSQLHDQAHLFFAMDGRPRNLTNDNFILIFNANPNDSIYDFQQLTLANNAFGKNTFDYQRHNGRANLLFVDSHAESLPLTPDTLRSLQLLEHTSN